MGKKSKNNTQQSYDRPVNEKESVVEMRGIVEEALPGTLFRVRCEGHTVLATISGKIRQNRIRVLPNDSVVVEVSAYDPTRGRITWRDK